MKKHSTRILGLVLALILALGVLSVTAAEELDPVTLEWYVATDQLPDNQLVFDALNAYLQEKINATINFHFVAPSEYSDKVGPILMSGQEVDIVNCNSGIGYVDYVKKDAFVPIEDLLPEFAPETYAMIPEGLWDAMNQVYWGGHSASVCSFLTSGSTPYAYAYPAACPG